MRRLKVMVTISFEPGRLGARSLIDAYAQLVPIYKRRARGDNAVSDKLKNATLTYRRAN